jgi:hypothetical protein
MIKTMRKLFLLSVIIAIFNTPLSALNFTRPELLNEGRRFTDTISKYIKVREKSFPTTAVIDVTFFPGYSVDTNQGEDDTRVTLAAFTLKYRAFDWLSIYFLLHHYDIVSTGRNSIEAYYSGGTLYPEYSDGGYKFIPIRYGAIEEFLLGFDISPFEFLTLNLSGIYSWEDLNNTAYDTRTISGIPNIGGINFESDGDPLYLEYRESAKRNFFPVFGIYLFDTVSSTLTYSPRSDSINSAESVVTIPIGEGAGNIRGAHTLYTYWDYEHGVQLGMNKIFGFLGFNAEFLSRRTIFSNFSLIIASPILHMGSVYYFRIHLEGNVSRTPETMIIRGSNRFVPGGKIDVGIYLWNRDPRWPQVFARFHGMYNHYDTMKIFRHSVENWGLGFSVGLQFNHHDMPDDEESTVNDLSNERNL